MYPGFRDNVHVEAVAEVDGVDVVAFQVAVHDGEEDLEEEVDGIEQDGEEEEPALSSFVSVRDLEMCMVYSCGRSWDWVRGEVDAAVPCF